MDRDRQRDLPDLNEPVPRTRPHPRRYQANPDPHSLHCILKTIASLMASIAIVIQLMMPQFNTSTTLLLCHSMEDSALFGATCKALLFSLIVLAFLQAVGLIHVRPRQILDLWYIKPRMRQRLIIWIDESPWEDPARFQEFFRISPSLFFYICELVHDDMITDPPERLRILPNCLLVVKRQVALALRRLATGDTFLTIGDPPERLRILPNCLLVVKRQVALALRRLATGDTFLTIGELFGVSKSSAVKVTWKFVESLRRRASHVIRWPDQAGLELVKQGFQSRWGFPNCCGAIDGTHLPIELPYGEDSIDYTCVLRQFG